MRCRYLWLSNVPGFDCNPFVSVSLSKHPFLYPNDSTPGKPVPITRPSKCSTVCFCWNLPTAQVQRPRNIPMKWLKGGGMLDFLTKASCVSQASSCKYKKSWTNIKKQNLCSLLSLYKCQTLISRWEISDDFRCMNIHVTTNTTSSYTCINVYLARLGLLIKIAKLTWEITHGGILGVVNLLWICNYILDIIHQRQEKSIIF